MSRSTAIAKVVPYPVYGGFLLLTSQAPKATDGLGAPELPEIDDGPHFFYGLQWWFFGVLAVFGFCYLAYDEWRGGPSADRLHRRRRTTSDEDEDDPEDLSEGAQHPAVDGEHHASDEGSRR